MSAAHICHADGCGTPCKPEHLMCARHWGKVPVGLQRAVYRTYRPGQCDDKKPSKAWLIAATRAIRAVAAAEGRPVEQHDRVLRRLDPPRVEVHVCAGCGAAGHWGYRPPSAPAGTATRWYCAAHRDAGEVWLLTGSGALRAPPVRPVRPVPPRAAGLLL